jgi:ABC-type enterochelin transport system substrate-binding protein|tara:strand:+ start:160 stop:531 length:372 start_codon:yes stop_codon:yes gene_type:complete
MSHSHDSEPNFEKLSKAITEAVMTSEKVRKIVEEIQKNDDICPQSFMVLVLKMQVLTESLELNIEEHGSAEKPVIPKAVRKKTPKKSQYIDGRKLSKRELDFEEFRSKQFDSESWLKKNRLTF